MRTTCSALLLGALLATTAGAQRLIAYDPLGSFMDEVQPPSAVLPGGGPPMGGYPTAPVLPPPPAGVPMPGDSTFDNAIGVSWFTDGMTTLAAMPSPALPAIGPIPAPIPIPAALLGAIGGPVTGIAIDPAAGVMWMTSMPGMVVGVLPGPGLPIVVPPFPIPFPAGPIAGLEWDGATGTLWAVDIVGIAYNFFPAGPPAAPPVAPPFPFPGPAGDIAIDKMGTINPFGLRPLYVSAGPMIFDINDPTGFPFPAGPPAEGLAFVNTPTQVPPLPVGATCGFCPATHPGPLLNFTTGPMTAGNPGWAIGVSGAAPVSIVIHAFDFAVFNPAFPTINPSGCPLGLLLTPGLILMPALTGPAGTATLPIPLTTVPVGTLLYNQTVGFCASDPTGFVFWPFQVIQVGGL